MDREVAVVRRGCTMVVMHCAVCRMVSETKNFVFLKMAISKKGRLAGTKLTDIK